MQKSKQAWVHLKTAQQQKEPETTEMLEQTKVLHVFDCCCDFLMSSAFIILSDASRRPMEMRALLRQVGQHTAVTTPAQLSAL